MTLIEITITLLIIAIVLSLAVITLRGYIPKQRLLSSAGILENLMQRAQAEASARNYWTCLKFTSTNPLTAQLWADVNSNHSSGDCGGVMISETPLKEDISLPDGTHCTTNIKQKCKIWFDVTGTPKKCPNSDAACGGNDPAACVDATYQIVLSTSRLDPGAKAREIEALSGGLIQTVKPGEKGLDPSLYAQAPGLTNGCE